MMDQHSQEQAHRLARVLVEQPDQAACMACLDILEDYVTAQLGQQNYMARFPQVAQHLDSCVECAESYDLIYQALAENQQTVAINVPEPDLRFLQQAAGPTNKSLQLKQALTDAIERTGKRLKLTLSQALLDLLPPPQQPAFAMRSSPSELGTPLFELEMDEPGEELMYLHLSVYREAGTPSRCTVRVQVTIQGRDWPDLEGIPIVLRAGDEQRRQQTDPWGEVVFTGVPAAALPGLQIEVEDAAPIRT